MNYRELLKNNRIRFLYASLAINFIIGIIKCITAITVLSPLFAISGLYNFTLCSAKVPYFYWNKQVHKWDWKIKQQSERKSMLIMDCIIVVLGILFAVFGFRMLSTGEEVHYSEYSVYLLALCAFIKLGVSIYWIIKLKGSNLPIDFTMKLTNFADALVSIVLTQSALLVMKGVAKSSYYDGIFGILVGITVIIIGIVSIFKASKKS